MPGIRLQRLPDRVPVKLVLHLPPSVHRLLVDYALFYREAYDEEAPLEELAPAMLEAFMMADRDFARRNGPAKR